MTPKMSWYHKFKNGPLGAKTLYCVALYLWRQSRNGHLTLDQALANIAILLRIPKKPYFWHDSSLTARDILKELREAGLVKLNDTNMVVVFPKSDSTGDRP